MIKRSCYQPSYKQDSDPYNQQFFACQKVFSILSSGPHLECAVGDVFLQLFLYFGFLQYSDLCTPENLTFKSVGLTFVLQLVTFQMFPFDMLADKKNTIT